MRIKASWRLVLALAVASISGCTKPDSGEEDLPDVGNLKQFRTSCGTIFEGEEENPIEVKGATRAAATVAGPNLLSLALKRGPMLVKLHGVEAPEDSQARSAAQEWMRSLVAEGEVYFYIAEPDCTAVLDDGTQGAVGAVFSAKGRSFSEGLLKKGLGVPRTDVCQGSKLASCYRALVEQAATPTPVATPVPNGPATARGFILWKPVSDKDGRLAVHSEPYGTRVIVKGETGRNEGGGNGYGSLARFRSSGCGYGRNVRLELVLSDGSKHKFGNQEFATIPDGCQRWTVDPKGKAAINIK